MEIVPAILSKDPSEARMLLEKILQAKIFNRVQVDFIDGEYANNETIKPMDLDLTAFLALDFEAHLMVTEKNLADYLRWVEKVGYDQVIVQMESISSPEKHKALAIDIHTPVSQVEPYLKNLELVTVMAIEPGFGGQQFDEQVYSKIERLASIREQTRCRWKIQVDGGVQKDHLEKLEKLGVDEVAMGAGRAILISGN